LGIFLPYFNLYCHHLGFDGNEIGTLSATRSIVVVIFSLAWSRIADHFRIRRLIYIICALMSSAIWAVYSFYVDFIAFFIITVCYSVFFAPIISFLEAFTMDLLGREKKMYGRIRVWGSLSFIAMVIAFGKLIDVFSARIILCAILAGSIFHSIGAFTLPKTVLAGKQKTQVQANVFLKKNVILFLTAAFLMLVSHGAYYGFFSIHLEALGFSGSFIGITWALASISEISVMVYSNHLFQRFTPEKLLCFSFAMAVFRWMILAFSTSAPVIVFSQLLHAFTYGTFHIAGILYIDKMTPEGSKTMGQAINNAVTYGLGLMVGFFMSGRIYEQAGSFSLFTISALIALVGGGVAWRITNE
jgi:PPP family 3-phenylpropionic acid transporter